MLRLLLRLILQIVQMFPLFFGFVCYQDWKNKSKKQELKHQKPRDRKSIVLAATTATDVPQNQPAQLVARHDGTSDGLRAACAQIAMNVDQDIKQVLYIVRDNIKMEALGANCVVIESMGIPIVKIVRVTGEYNKMALVINLSQVRQEFAQLPILTSEEVVIAWVMIILVAIVFFLFQNK